MIVRYLCNPKIRRILEETKEKHTMESKNLLLEMQNDYNSLIIGFSKKAVSNVFPNGFISFGIKRHRGVSIDTMRNDLNKSK